MPAKTANRRINSLSGAGDSNDLVAGVEALTVIDERGEISGIDPVRLAPILGKVVVPGRAGGERDGAKAQALCGLDVEPPGSRHIAFDQNERLLFHRDQILLCGIDRRQAGYHAAPSV